MSQFQFVSAVLEPVAVEEQGNAAETCVPGPDDNGVWRAYHSSGTAGAARIRYATSRDGISFQRHGVVISNNYPRNRVDVVRDGSMYYATICDMSGPGYNGGNLYGYQSINGVDFTDPILMLAPGAGKNWQNSRRVKIGTTWWLYAESDLNGNSQWRTYLFSGPTARGPWTPEHGGLPLLSLLPSGTDTGANETASPPSIIVRGDRLFGFLWVNNLAATGSLSLTEIYVAQASIADPSRWSKPLRVLEAPVAPLWNGRATVQLADACAVLAGERIHLYCSQVDTMAHARTILHTFDGPPEALFPADRYLNGNPVSPTQPVAGQSWRFSSAREWEPIDAFDALLIAPPTGTTATVSGDGAPSPNGTFIWHPNYEQFTIPGQWALIHSAGAWEIRDSANIARYRGPSAPATLPTGPLTALAGATGTATVVFNPATATKRALYGGNGSPMFTAPRGSLYVRKDGTGSAFYVYEVEWIAK